MLGKTIDDGVGHDGDGRLGVISLSSNSIRPYIIIVTHLDKFTWVTYMIELEYIERWKIFLANVISVFHANNIIGQIRVMIF